ncbi:MULTISPECIES: extracellular matrix regulator RemB [Bacillaceae]|uniref:DUF370 domain-containing protein n=1 Tax=Evansella alkalicola TaxID=745819 RepID=A0ABS6JUN8_9BACI|nr:MULTISPECIES: DUF370 domain-containing protein [Bacillaceae]MBU9722293.1 DUF370 domain-containing protein [Bacillus alkalicola]
MFIHLGGDIVIRSNKIIAILDFQSNGSQDNQSFLIEQKRGNNTISITEDTPKSVVVTDENIYLSPISSHTLKRRSETVTVLEEEDYN